MGKFQICSLQIQIILLILSHPVDLLFRIRLKPHGKVILPSDQRFELSGFYEQRTGGGGKHILSIAEKLFQQQFPILIVERNLTNVIDDGRQLPVPDPCFILIDPDLYIPGIRRFDGQCPVLRIQDS